jgi:hypothetical protein
MLRLVQKWKPNLNPNEAAGCGDSAAPVRAEVAHDVLKVEVERLKAELATIKHDLHAARNDDRKELDRLIEQFSAYQRLAKSAKRQAGKSAPVFQQGETPEVKTVPAVQHPIDCCAKKPTVLEGLRSEGLRLEELRLK